MYLTYNKHNSTRLRPRASRCLSRRQRPPTATCRSRRWCGSSSSRRRWWGRRTPTYGSWKTTSTTCWCAWWRRRPASCGRPTSQRGRRVKSLKSEEQRTMTFSDSTGWRSRVSWLTGTVVRKNVRTGKVQLKYKGVWLMPNLWYILYLVSDLFFF